MKQATPRATAAIYVPTYPPHDKDGGPFLPTASGGLICGKCHTVIAEPDFRVLQQAREAHKATGEPLVEVGKRPAPSAIRVKDLTPAERRSLCSVAKGNLKALSDKSVAPLIGLGLVVATQIQGAKLGAMTLEATEDGTRLARLCAAESERPAPETATMFDLGEPDPEAVRRLDRRNGARARR